MKKVFAVILSLAMVLSLAACGNKSEPTPDPAAPADTPTGATEVIWWTYFGDTNIGYLQNIIDAFNASQEDYHVTVEFQGSQSEMNAKIQSTVTSDLPAMFSGAVENLSMYNSAEYCVPIQTFVDADSAGWPELEHTYASVTTAYSNREGQLVGYPIGNSYGTLFFNKELLEKAGFDGYTDLKSLADIYEVSKALVTGGHCTYGIGFHPDGYYTNGMMCREGIAFYDNGNGYDGDVTQCMYVSDPTVNAALVESLTYYQKLHGESLCIPFGTDTNGEVIPAFGSGDCAMFMGVISQYTKLTDGASGAFSVGAVPLPSMTTKGKCTGVAPGGTGSFIAACPDTKAQQGAYEFIKFCSTGKWNAYFATATGYLPANDESFNDPSYQSFMKEKFPDAAVLIKSQQTSDESGVSPFIPISNEMKAANVLMVSTVSSDPKASVTTAIQVANDTINEAIELYNMSNGIG